MVENRRRISFHFRAEGPGNTPSAIEKTDSNGNKRKYLQGVASGLKVDAHGERMTEKAIASFMRQAASGDLLLYSDVHGIQATKDIGILNDARVLENGDWFTEYRLYDAADEVDQASTESATKLWKQVNGLPPYKRPKSKGFSIEGFVPEEPGAIELDSTGRKAINEVELDGTVVVPRPAYEDSVTSAVYKALGETMPGLPEKTLAGHLRQMVDDGEEAEEFYRQRYLISDATSDLVDRIMAEEDDGTRRERLDAIFQEQHEMMVDLVMRHPDAFKPDGDMPMGRSVSNEEREANLNKALLASLEDLESVFEGEDMVSKAMTQEERAIVQNVLSLLTQLTQAGTAGAESAEQPARDAAPQSAKSVAKGATMKSAIAAKIMNGEKLSDEEKLEVIEQLGAAAISGEGEEDEEVHLEPEEMELGKDESTASDSAEERLGDQEETTDDAIGDVGENMASTLKALTSVITKALAPIIKEQKVQADYIEVLMDGNELTQDVIKGIDTKEPEKVVKSVDQDAPLTIKDLVPVLQTFGQATKSENELLLEDSGLVESFDVRKSKNGTRKVGNLAGAMTELVGAGVAETEE